MPSSIGQKGLGVAKAALGVALLGLASKFLGFLREVVLAKYFGAAAATDAYLVALVIPGVVVAALINAITVTFIPVFAEYEAKRGEAAAILLVNKVLNLLLLLSVGLGAIGYVCAPQIVRFLAPGFSGHQAALAAQLTRLMFPAVLATALNGLAAAVLQSRQKYWVPAAIGLPYNVIMVTAIIISSRYWGIAGVAVGTVLAVFSQAIFQLFFLYQTGFRYRPVLDWQEEGVRKIAALIWPVLVGLAASQLNLVVDRWLASTLPEGSISALNYAAKLVLLPQGLMVSAVTSVTYPLFAQLAATNQRDKMQEAYLTTVKTIVLLFVPLTTGMIVLGEPFVRAAFQRGAFDASDTSATAVAFLFYSLGVLFYALNDLSNKAFYSLQDTRTPVRIGVAMVLTNIVLNLLLVKPMAHGGLALATSLASFLGTVSYLLFFRRRYGLRGGRRLFLVAAVALAASAVMGVVVWFLYRLLPWSWTHGGFLRQVAALLGPTAAGVLVYLGLIKASRLPEGEILFAIITKIFQRTKPSDRLLQEVEMP